MVNNANVSLWLEQAHASQRQMGVMFLARPVYIGIVHVSMVSAASVTGKANMNAIVRKGILWRYRLN